jgi:hypothetical protein
VRNLSLHDMYRHPLTIYIGAANNLVTNVTAYHAYGTSPLAIYGPGTTGNLVRNSTFYNDTSLSSAYLPAGVWAVIVAHGGSTNNTVDSCLIYSTASSPGGYGILVGDAGTAVTFSHNFVYGSYAYGVDVGSGGGDGLGNGASLTLWDNLLDISQASNVGILLTGSVGSIVYDNTVYGPSNTNAAISQASTSTGALVKNNVFYAGAYASVDASSEAGTVYDYNDYFSASGTPFSWGRHGVFAFRVADECCAGCALVQCGSGVGECFFAVVERELCAAGGFAGDQCGSESWLGVSDGADACGFVAWRGVARESEFGGQRVGNWRVRLSRGWDFDAVAARLLRLRFQ